MTVIYAITTPALCDDRKRFARDVASALDAGVDWLQLRDKTGDAGRRAQLGEIARHLCGVTGATLIINDDLALAESLDAGVHLGQGDAAVATARERLGSAAQVGVTCHDSASAVRSAFDAGASYASVGRLFDSATKPDAPATDLQSLATIAGGAPGPICAIGGITAGRVAAVCHAGARIIAVADGIFGSEEPARAVARFRDAIDRFHSINDLAGQ